MYRYIRVNLALRIVFYTSLLLIVLGILVIWQSLKFSKTKLIFCDVGQGDAILLSLGTKQVLVDGGQGSRVLECLGDRLPFWDRTVEMVVLTHPQRDHMEGLIAVLERYGVERIITTGVKADTDVFRAWEAAVKSEGAVVHTTNLGEKFVIDRGRALTMTVLWPAKAAIGQWKINPPKDLNESSIVMRLDFADPSTHSVRSGQLCAYLTGDIPREILEGLIDRQCEILKIAHHGSRTGTSLEILEKAKPKIAVIQSGKNSYGHPHKEVLDLLESHGVKILRNDLIGMVEIVDNGRSLVTVD